jgi:hypothetical protein
MASNIITLYVSGRKFRTSKSVLSVSPYFESLFTRWESCADLQADGSYYIDADPDTFEHLLNFMRRPARFPLYWTKENGLDIVLYSKVEAEADYFMLEALRKWIKEKKYLGAIRTEQRTFENSTTTSWVRNGDFSVQSFVVKGEGHPICPSGRHHHSSYECQRENSCLGAMSKDKDKRLVCAKGGQKLLTVAMETRLINEFFGECGGLNN